MSAMAVNKVVYGTTVLVDLTKDTVTPDKLLKGATAHDASGEPITGTMEAGSGDSAAGVIDRSVVNITSDAADVGQYAFYGCGQLETVSFPMATKIQGGAFVGCKALVSVSAPNVTEITNEVTDYLHFDMDGNYVKDTISAFTGCANLTTVNFPMAETIFQTTFSDCKGLTILKFPRVKTIGASGGTGDMGEEM